MWLSCDGVPQGDIRRVRTAVVAGVAVPLAMFLAWDAVILGSLGAGGAGAGGGRSDPLAELAAVSPATGALIQVRLLGYALGLG